MNSGSFIEPAEEEAFTEVLVPVIVGCALFMELLDSTVIATALPAMSRSLHEDPIKLNLAITSYLLSLAVFIPISAWMADRFGTRDVFASAIGIFTLGSFLCGICSNIHLLVACRVLQGMGGAMMVPVGRLTLVRAFPKSELIRMMSFVTIPALIAPMLGPVAGGLNRLQSRSRRGAMWFSSLFRPSRRQARSKRLSISSTKFPVPDMREPKFG